MAKDKTAPWNMKDASEGESAEVGGMVSMERTKAEKKKEKEMGSPVLAGGDGGPDYPYGLSVELRDESLKKLGIGELPEVGTKMVMECEVEVVRTSQRAGKDSADREVGFQIVKMKLESAE
jgi:hypothetical protein